MRIHPNWDHPRVKPIEAKILRKWSHEGEKGKVRDFKIRVWWKGECLVNGKLATKTLHRTIWIRDVPIKNTNDAKLVVSPSLPISKAWTGLIWPEEPGVIYWNS